MANKYAGTSSVCCATCPFSNSMDKDKDGKIKCQKDGDRVKPTWVCVDHPDKKK